jgi:hypothetical protein
MINPRLRFGLGDCERDKEEGAKQPGNNLLPHHDDGNGQTRHPEGHALTSATYTSSYKARKAGTHHSYPQFLLRPMTASRMANQQGYSRLPNDNDDNRDLANPDQSWNPDNDTLTSAAHSSADIAHNAPPHGSTTGPQMPMSNVPNPVQYVSEDKDADTVMQDNYSDLPSAINGPLTSRPPPASRPTMALCRLLEPHYGEPFITLTERQTINSDTVLEPVIGLLVNLKETTVPDYHPGLRTSGQEKVLAARLEGIAKHIQEQVERLGEAERGVVEMRLW